MTSRPSRREVLAASAAALLVDPADAATIKNALPWKSGTVNAPTAAAPGAWRFFTAEEAATVEAFVDRLIPPDPQTPGGKDAGCAVYIDRQLAGAYGSFEGDYTEGPFHPGTPQQGPQSPVTPKQHYRAALTGLDRHCRETLGAAFAELPDGKKDELIKGLEEGSLKFEGAHNFFKLILNDTQQGFLADPIYGGNKDFAGWQLVGFPGAQMMFTEQDMLSKEAFTREPIVGLQSRLKGKKT